MKSFEEAWDIECKEEGYQYGEDALENVKLGWELFEKHMHMMTKEEFDQLVHPDIQAMLSQVVIVLVNKEGGKLSIPVADIDGTGQYMMYMEASEDNQNLIFTTGKKS